MRHYQFVFVLLIFSICIGCGPIKEDENHHYTIPFYNNTEADVYIDSSDSYPDTIVTDLYGGPYHKVKARSVNSDGLRQRVTYEISFKDGRRFPSDTLIVIVFDAKQLEADRHNVMDALLVRYDLSLKDLQRLNWTLSYPPTENMKDIKMWPRFEKNEEKQN